MLHYTNEMEENFYKFNKILTENFSSQDRCLWLKLEFFIHFFNKYLLNVYYVPETSRIGNRRVSKIDKFMKFMYSERLTSSNREAS